jgi:hypothetical protein
VRTAAALGAAALGPLALALAGVDYVEPRNLIVASLPLAVVAGAGFAMLPRKSLGAAGAAVLCALGLASVVGIALEPSWQRERLAWHGARSGPPGARAVVIWPAKGVFPLGLYLRGLGSFPARGVSLWICQGVRLRVRRRVGGPVLPARVVRRR